MYNQEQCLQVMENGEFRFAFANAMAGEWWGIMLAILWVALFVYFYFGRKKDNEKYFAEKESNAA